MLNKLIVIAALCFTTFAVAGEPPATAPKKKVEKLATHPPELSAMGTLGTGSSVGPVRKAKTVAPPPPTSAPKPTK